MRGGRVFHSRGKVRASHHSLWVLPNVETVNLDLRNKCMLLRRHILLPALLSGAVMYLISWLWHGLALHDLDELSVPMTLYFTLAGVVYMLLGFALTFAVHTALQHEWISLKHGFPLASGLVGSIVGFVVYLVIFVLGMSFAKGGMVHVVADVLWQMFEQAVGGLCVSLGIIYDMHKRYLETERSH